MVNQPYTCPLLVSSAQPSQLVASLVSSNLSLRFDPPDALHQTTRSGSRAHEVRAIRDVGSSVRSPSHPFPYDDLMLSVSGLRIELSSRSKSPAQDSAFARNRKNQYDSWRRYLEE